MSWWSPPRIERLIINTLVQPHACKEYTRSSARAHKHAHIYVKPLVVDHRRIDGSFAEEVTSLVFI